MLHGNRIDKSILELYETNNKIQEFITSCYVFKGSIVTIMTIDILTL